ncbi:MAG: hypothetical protein HYZ28_26595 [Myxococcales bacterium]|nr:hypothetical protein [Myxococcales bacterium]
MEAAQLIAEAESRARQLEPEPAPEQAVERLRTECFSMLDRIPEPPLYRRSEDPARQLAGELLSEGQELLALAVALSRVSEVREAAAPLAEVMKEILDYLCQVAEGRVREAEAALRRARELERRVARASRAWSRSDEDAAPVFDRRTGASRYDERPPPSVTAKLSCPRASCRLTEEYSFSSDHATQEFTCAGCGQPFTAYFAEAIDAGEVRQGARRRLTFRLEELSGRVTRLELDDRSGAELSVVRGDFLAFLYAPPHQVRGLLNLSTSRVLWVQRSGACFVATAVFGEQAPELEAFRAYRDRVLEPSPLGRALIRGYYSLGPGLARLVTRQPWLRRAARRGFSALYRRLSRSGFS